MAEPQDKRTMEEISQFYTWSMDYWQKLSSDPQLGFQNLLNFGCWDQHTENLCQAQLNLFEKVSNCLETLPSEASGLEIGCGLAGNSLRLMQNSPVRMTALDISARQLELAGECARHLNLEKRIDFVHGNSMSMPFDDQRFDFSLCIESTFHYQRLDMFAAEQYRVLKPGARGVIVDITCSDSSKVRFRQGNHFYPVEKLVTLLKEQGADILSVQNIGSQVFVPLYRYTQSFNRDNPQFKGQVSKYWSLVLANYANLAERGIMDYHIVVFRRPLC